MHILHAFSTMADRISSLPDPILCYILSFLPTKQAVSTSVLSKRWKLLWRSVPSLDFELVKPTNFCYDIEKEVFSRFHLSVNSFLRGRDMDQPLLKFRLICPSLHHQNSIEKCIEDVLRRSARLEHLDLELGWDTAVPSVLFICKTLVVLKLTDVALENISFIDLPLLKILHLSSICFYECGGFFNLFLSGCPNLEDFEVNTWGNVILEEFELLPKLVRAKIDTVIVPLDLFKNVEVLITDKIHEQDLVCDFQNLVQLEFTTWEFREGWLHFWEVFRHCPKLQTLVIRIDSDEEEPLLSFPLNVPTCISLHLKTCCLRDYRGSTFEFQFAKYIMLNANHLLTMKFLIHSDEYNDLMRRHDMIRDLSSCSRSSDTCTLLFEKSLR